MEDIFDTFLVQVQQVDGLEITAADTQLTQVRRMRWKVVRLFAKTKARHNINTTIQDINEKLQELVARRGNIIPKPAVPAAIDPRILSLYKNSSELVGLDGPMEELIRMLAIGGDDLGVSVNKTTKIISIFGFGGVGKTTLAKAVYDKLKSGFDCMAFVPVGQNPDMKKVLRDILIDLQRTSIISNMMLDVRQLMVSWTKSRNSSRKRGRPANECASMEAMTGSMRTLLPKLSLLVMGEYMLQAGVKKKINFLLRELQTVHAFLRKIGEVPWEQLDEPVKLWACDLREASYDMEDVVDTFLVQVQQVDGLEITAADTQIRRLRKKMGQLFSKTKARHNIDAAIQDINEKLQGLAARRGNIIAKPAVPTSIDPRLLSLYKNSSELVGLDGPMEELIRMLAIGGDVSVNEATKIISIFGFGGLGKTTLAKAVYDELKSGFDCMAFVPVGQNPDMKKVLRDILIDLQPTSINSNMMLDVRQLMDKVQEFLEKKRYLLVIDDIWKVKDWELLRLSLPNNHLGSRIITTTRILTVAESCCSHTEGNIYKMDPLSDLDSQRLFFKRIFGSDDGCPAHLKNISMDILKRCGGLPLAILTLSSSLANKPMLEEEWKQVHRSSSGYDSVKSMNQILSLSFHDLPHHLKTCLLYLSIFPEDYVIEREQLVWRWIAEGFIQETWSSNLEDIGSSYFNELINRSMIQPADVQYGTVQTCRVHDMILELIVSISTKVNFVSVLYQDQTRFTDYKRKIRRLSYQSDRVENLVKEMSRDDIFHVRSFNPFGSVKEIPHLGDFQALRVLYLGSCRSIENHHIENLGRLYQLKYLDLRRTSISELPKQIENLRYLETLDLRGCAIEELPASTVRLQNLQRLLVNRSVKFPDEIGRMQALQMLLSVSMSYNSIKFVEEISKLIQLRILNITFAKPVDMVDEVRKYTDSLVSSLNELVNLESLKIDPEKGCSLDSLIGVYLTFDCLKKLVTGYISRIPKWISSLNNLVHLEIKVDIVQEEDLHSIERLPSLLYLQLEITDGSSKMLTVGSNGFRCLRESQYTWKNNGMGLVFLEGAMPELQMLHLYLRTHKTIDSQNNRTTDNSGVDGSGIENLSGLKKLCIDVDCTGSTKEEVEAVEASIRKVADRHSTKLTLEIQRWCEACMIEEEGRDDNTDVPRRPMNRRANPVRVAFR
uniref:NB-ARC domain-containing protein n=1 Tax=Oryza punctata TaxID=4537 RepID=A0A0E0LUK3_ORYPU